MEKNKKTNLFKNIVIIFLVFIIVLLLLNRIKFKENKLIEGEKIEEQIVNLSEIANVKYNYTDVLLYENTKQISGIDVPFTKKKFIVKYSGYIKIGHDFKKLKIDLKEDKVNIKLPDAKVLDNVIMEEEVFFLDEKNGIFNKLSYDNLYESLIKEKEAKEKEALSSGLVDEANNNFKDLLLILFEDLGYKDININ